MLNEHLKVKTDKRIFRGIKECGLLNNIVI